MKDAPNTIFLRLEGPLQAWGDNSKFVIRRSMEAPTKSGVIGLICCAMGLSRQASRKRLPQLQTLKMGVRIDRPGTRWWDYQTVGAGYGILTAEGKIKKTASTGKYETLVSRREYLCDASFLVAFQGDTELIPRIKGALENPKWLPFLGRKSCPPSAPILAEPRECEKWTNPDRYDDLRQAMEAVPWHPRLKEIDKKPGQGQLLALIEWQPHDDDPGEVWYDVPVSFDPPVHEPRFVRRTPIKAMVGAPLQHHTSPPPRIRADYGSEPFKTIRRARLDSDNHLCVFCKSPLTKYTATVQHVTYRHARKEDYRAAIRDETLTRQRLDELRSLCRLCHDAVTMVEYGLGMGLDRINPEDPRWRDQIIRKRAEIIKFRSLETRRRRLQPEEVE